MGRVSANSMAAMEVDIDTKLSWHLSSNHYPPVPTAMVPTCVKAIEACNEGDSERRIELPEGIAYKDGTNTAPAGTIVDALHLDSFLDPETEYYID